MEINFKDLLTVSFTLFAVIVIVGAVPVLISLNTKLGGINEGNTGFRSPYDFIFFIGEPFLNLLGVDVRPFAVAGSIVIFLIGLEM